MSNEALNRLLGKPFNAAKVFAALGDSTRLAMVIKLSDGSQRSISQLAAGETLTRQAIRKHLGVLQDAHLVRSLRAGREHRFVLDPQSVEDAGAYIALVSRQWDESLSRLKSLVED